MKLSLKSSPSNSFNINRLHMHGVIQTGKKGIHIGAYRHLIEEAFTKHHPKLVLIDLNTPGGSPSQSDLIYNEIMYWKEKTGIPVYVVVQEVCASGGIWIAMAADKIFVNRVAVIGSIGVVARYFGFVEVMKKLGIEQRVHTAGKNKAGISPFADESAEQKAKMREDLDDLHALFKKHVIQGRGNKLDLKTPDLFEGTVWKGYEAVEFGLVDALGYTREAINSHPDITGQTKPKIHDLRPKSPGLISKIMGDTSLADETADILYAKLMEELMAPPFKLM
ncbi:MAG: S49 family peptidase [Alphaproteobacteria bacterium]|nr:S49 family peptidase [Alphaproteobacteria bacterium]